MIKVNKNLENIPQKLTNQSTQQAFERNMQEQKYLDEKDKRRYTSKGIRNKLNKIYNNKCAYCERQVLDSEKSIEDYRPKSTYYWLSYSWDNLLFCCKPCNEAKKNTFDTKNRKVNYNNESFKNIHNLGVGYNKIEEPFIINPEVDNIIDDIYFDENGTILSKNIRVEKTVKIVGLNREELKKLRLVIINNFRNRINEEYSLLKQNKNISELKKYIENFIEKINAKQEYYSLNNFIIRCPDIYFQDKIIKFTVKKIFNKTTEI